MNNTEPKLIRVETVADLPVLWVILERLQYEHTIRVYQLPTDVVRSDATTANSHVGVSDPTGLLQFGHSKAALSTRAFIQAGGDFYLCPLSETQLSRDARNEVLQALWDGTEVLQSV